MSDQIHLTIPEELSERYRKFASDFGFKNVQRVIVTVMRKFVDHADKQKTQPLPVRLSIEDEIDDMFNELEALHIMPETTPPPQIRRPRIRNIEEGDEVYEKGPKQRKGKA